MRSISKNRILQSLVFLLTFVIFIVIISPKTGNFPISRIINKVPVTPTKITTTKTGKKRILDRKNGKMRRCLEIADLHFSVEILVLDRRFLESILNETCHNKTARIQVAINSKYSKTESLQKDARFDIIFYNTSEKIDYLELLGEKKQIIPKNFKQRSIENIRIPENIPQFLEFLRRSSFIECLNLPMLRKGKRKVILDAQKSVDSLAMLRDDLLDFGMFLFLNSGTLLGWYRECSIIPHTTDMDINVFSADLNPDYLDYLKTNKSKFSVARRFGKILDSLELTLESKYGYKAMTDVFFMYEERFENGTIQNWFGGVDGKGNKYKFTYPEYNPWCAADLLGHIFWVTCTPIKMMVNEYGPNWYIDHETSNFPWTSGPKNIYENGKWTDEEMKEVYYVRPKKQGIFDYFFFNFLRFFN